MIRRGRAALLAILSFAGLSAAQALEIPPVAYPAIADRAERLQDFVPAGWRLEHVARGRLDADDVEDAVLLLRMDDPGNRVANPGPGADPFDTNPRMLVAVLAVADGGYRRAMVDHALIPRPWDPAFDDVLQDDPDAAIGIDSARRTLSVGLHSWASAGTWTTRSVAFTFRHQDGCFRLIGHDGSELHRASLDSRETSVNHLTGRAWTRRGSMREDADGPKRRMRFDAGAPVCIEQVGNGLAFPFPHGVE